MPGGQPRGSLRGARQGPPLRRHGSLRGAPARLDADGPAERLSVGRLMKVAALGDAHLGRSYLPFTTPEGVNQREYDFEVSFQAAVELALEQQPDLVVWLGDIFDHPRPTYRSFVRVQRMLAKIRDHGVPA